MSTAADYVGRTIDVLAFSGAKPVGEVLLTQSLAKEGQSGEVCTGLQKMAQRWLIEFLTVRGSLKYLPDRGCDFVSDMWAGTLSTTLDAEQSFYLAADQVKTNLQAEETGDEPGDERFKDAELLSLVLNGDQLILRVRLTSVTGGELILPIPVNVRTK